ncbi:MAG TPA: hypothetical protein VHM72_03755 [Solirubrobacteraceae bacterium]|jgi:uncharacterized membrane protein|nr:hypothetical protein [Solirubrobacteraceae bacterium]
MPAGNWLLPLISGLTVLILTAVAVYVLSSLWHAQTGGGEDEATPAGDHTGLSAAEILDRRLASGEITIAEYEELLEVLGRRHAAAAGAVNTVSNVAASNGAATAVA